MLGLDLVELGDSKNTSFFVYQLKSSLEAIMRGFLLA
jgi:hypothetical protein